MERMVKEFAICANSLEYLPCPKAFFQKFRYLALKPTCEVEKKMMVVVFLYSKAFVAWRLPECES